MQIKRTVQQLIQDLSFKNGLAAFISALLPTIFIATLLMIMVIITLKGTFDFLAICLGLSVSLFILSSYARDKKIENLEKTVKEDKSLIEKLTKKDKGIDYNTLNRKMKEFQDD